MSAEPSPTCGALEEVLSTLVTITGCLGALPVRSRPVSGQYVGSGGSLVADEVGSEGAASRGRLLVVPAAAAGEEQRGRDEGGHDRLGRGRWRR